MNEQVDPPAVLYIEDDLANRTLVKRILEAEGYRVLEADNGIEGLELARRERPALIFVDISMPDMDGYQVATQLRQMDEVRGAPIVALTANVMKGDREKSLAAGCTDYIQKPLDVDLLPVKVADLLGL
ncbi:MAG: response regulator [Anaerolineae bacterium]|nr:response regulator [Anaerolineae bacterium]